MSDSHSTTPAVPGKSTKPSKPYPEFPLFAHAAGVWAKKIRGKLHYFGPWGDPDAALAKYNEQKDALHAGKKPRESTEGLTVKELVNRFLNAKLALVKTGELSPRTWACYKEATDATVAAFSKSRLVSDLDPQDFASLRNRLAKRYGPHGLGTRIQCVRSAFKFAFDSGLIDRPVRYGPEFKRPSKKTLRLHRAKQGKKRFTPEEIRKLIDAADVQLKAMLLAWRDLYAQHIGVNSLDEVRRLVLRRAAGESIPEEELRAAGERAARACDRLKEWLERTAGASKSGAGDQGGAGQPEEAGELTDRQRSILETMLEHEITSERRRKTRAEVVRLINRTHKAQSYNRDFAALVKRGFLHSREGPRGGVWLTPIGKTEAQRIRSRNEHPAD